MVLVGRCCLCGKPEDPINFRVFDFDTGALIWEDYLYSPAVGTDGSVYSVKVERAFRGWGAPAVWSQNWEIPIGDVIRSVDGAHDCEVIVIQKQTPDGVVVGTSPVHRVMYQSTAGVTPPNSHALLGGMRTSRWLANADDEIILRAVNQNGAIEVVVDGSWSSAEATYYFKVPRLLAGEGTLRLPLHAPAGAPAYTDAIIGLWDDHTAIAAAIQSAYGGNVLSVTVSGGDVPCLCPWFAVEIEWLQADTYIEQVKLEWATASFPTYMSDAWIFDLMSSQFGNGREADNVGPTSGASGRWLTNGQIFGGLSEQMDDSEYSHWWDPTTEPWTIVRQTDFIGVQSYVIPNIQKQGRPRFASAAQNGKIALYGNSVTSPNDPLVRKFSLITVNEDGTDITYYDQADGPYSGDESEAVIQDDGTDVGTQHVEWLDWNEYKADPDDPFGNKYENRPTVFGNGFGVPFRIHSTTVNVTQLHAGVGGGVGFTADAVAIASTAETSPEHSVISLRRHNSPNAYYGDAIIRGPLAGGSVPSGYLNPVTLNEMRVWEHFWEFMIRGRVLYSDATEWRLNWSVLNGGVTQWFAHDATLADLQAELDLLTGFNITGASNVQAIEANPVQATIVEVPLWQRGLTLTAWGAEDEDDEPYLMTPPALSLGSGTARNVNDRQPPMTVEVRNASNRIEHELGAINRTTGLLNWSRNFRINKPAVTLKGACLLNNRLYVHGPDSHPEMIIVDISVDGDYPTNNGPIEAGDTLYLVDYDNVPGVPDVPTDFTEVAGGSTVFGNASSRVSWKAMIGGETGPHPKSGIRTVAILVRGDKPSHARCGADSGTDDVPWPQVTAASSSHNFVVLIGTHEDFTSADESAAGESVTIHPDFKYVTGVMGAPSELQTKVWVQDVGIPGGLFDPASVSEDAGPQEKSAITLIIGSGS